MSNSLPAPVPPLLHTSRLTLSLYSSTSPHDAAFFVSFLNDSRVISVIGDAGISTPSDWSSVLSSWSLDPLICNGHVDAPIYLLRITKLGPESKIIGFVGLRQVLRLPDLGYGLLPQWWGRGYATEAAREMLRLVMEEMGIRRVVGYTFAGHEDSVKVMCKIGMIHVGTVRLREEEGKECGIFVVQGMEGEDLVLEDRVKNEDSRRGGTTEEDRNESWGS